MAAFFFKDQHFVLCSVKMKLGWPCLFFFQYSWALCLQTWAFFCFWLVDNLLLLRIGPSKKGPKALFSQNKKSLNFLNPNWARSLDMIKKTVVLKKNGPVSLWQIATLAARWFRVVVKTADSWNAVLTVWGLHGNSRFQCLWGEFSDNKLCQ